MLEAVLSNPDLQSQISTLLGTLLVAVISALIAAIKLPEWATNILREATRTAVLSTEQKSKSATPASDEERLADATATAKTLIPIAVKAITPNLNKKIATLIEGHVGAMNEGKK